MSNLLFEVERGFHQVQHAPLYITDSDLDNTGHADVLDPDAAHINRKGRNESETAPNLWTYIFVLSSFRFFLLLVLVLLHV